MFVVVKNITDMKVDNHLFELNGRVPLAKAIPFGLQHVLAMFVANITPIIILSNVAGIAPALSAALIQNCMIIAGIGTLIQLYPVWRIGARLPIVMGMSFTFLTISLYVATTQGMGVLMGAVIVGGIIEGVLGLFAHYWVKAISPIVAATVVTAIGFSLLYIGANSFAGGHGAADFGSAQNWIVGSFTLLVCVLFQVLSKGAMRALSVLLGMIAGYLLAICLGMVDFSEIDDIDIVALPEFMPFKPEFNLGAILSVLAIYFVSMTETVGDASALCSGALKRMPTERELGASVSCDGFVSSLAALFGCTPITSFSQNVGLATLSGVVNRFAIATGACIMIVGGIFPIVGALLTSIPQSVIGGCSIMMFGSILYAGFSMVAKCGFSDRNMAIVAISLGVGLGFTQVTGMFNIFPKVVQNIFDDNCVAIVFIFSVALNVILPKGEDKQ